MKDLIYDDAAWSAIKKAIPEAEWQHASDEIHPNRIEVEIPDERKDDYFKAAIRDGFSGVSFHFQLMLRGLRKGDIDQIKQWCKELKENKCS